MEAPNIVCTTTFDFDGYRIKEYRGLVRGIVVRAPTITQGLMGGLKKIIGGRIGAYKSMCEDVRMESFEEMLQHAQELGANAVVGLRYESSAVTSEASEVLCYGTAVVIESL